MFLKPFKVFVLKLRRGKREEISPKIIFVRLLAARNSNGSLSALFFGKINKITKRIPFMTNDYV